MTSDSFIVRLLAALVDVFLCLTKKFLRFFVIAQPLNGIEETFFCGFLKLFCDDFTFFQMIFFRGL